MRKKNVTSPWKKLFIYGLIILSLVAGYLWGNRFAQEHQQFANLTPYKNQATLPPFALQRSNGTPFSLDDLMGHWTVIIAGRHDSNNARDLLTLATQVNNRLAATKEIQERYQILFLDLDQNTDTAENIARFTHNLNPKVIALSGNRADLELFAKNNGIHFKTIPHQDGGYTDYGTAIPLIAPDVRLLGLFTGRVDPVSIAADIQSLDSH